MADDKDLEPHTLPENPTQQDLLDHYNWLQRTIVTVEKKLDEYLTIRNALLQEREVFRSVLDQAGLGAAVMEAEMRHRGRSPQNVKARPFVEKAILGWLRASPGTVDEVVRGIKGASNLEEAAIRQAIEALKVTGEIREEGGDLSL